MRNHRVLPASYKQCAKQFGTPRKITNNQTPQSMKRYVLLVILLFPLMLLAQERFLVDSLSMRMDAAEEDSTKVKILLKLSDTYQYTDFKQSLEYANSALALANSGKLRLQQARSHKKIADILFRKGLYDRSLDHYLKSKKIFEEEKNHIALVGVEHNMGSIFYRLLEYDKALEHYKVALSMQNKILAMGDSTYYTQHHAFYNSIGNCYNVKKEYEIAKTYFLKALKGAQKFDDKLNLGVIYNNLGKVSMETGKYDESLEYMKLSLQARKAINDKNGMSRSHLFMAEYYRKTGAFQKALVEANLGKDLASEAGSMLSLMEAYQTISQIKKELGDSNGALMAYQKFHQYNDSIINEASVREVTSLQMQYEFDKLEKERQVKQQRKEMIYLFLMAILVLGMIITGLLYGFIKSRAKAISLEKQTLEKDLVLKNQDLEIKNKELTTNVMYLLKKNELITSVSSRLLQLKSQLKQENKEPIQKIIFDLQAGADQDVWEEFELRFQQVHNDYYKKLQERFPNLSPSEVKLCAFLKLNMTSKEISSIIHQSVKSIEVSRSRIRKKLDLTGKDVNLVTFLSEL